MPVAIGAVVTTIDLDALLQQLGRKVNNLRPFFATLDADLSERLRAQFTTRGAAFDTPWAALSPVTPRVRIAKRMTSKKARAAALRAPGADTPLRDTDGLYDSWTKPGAPGSVRIIDALTYVRGTSYTVDGFPVAVAMQTGFKSVMRPLFDRKGDVFFARRKVPVEVPARPVKPDVFPAPILRAWEGQLVAYLESGALGAQGA